MHELGEVVKIQSGGTPSKARKEFWNGDVPWITARDMRGVRVHTTTRCLTEAGAAVARVMPARTVFVLTRGMTLFRDLPVVINDQPASFNQVVKALTPLVSSLDPEFLAYYLTARKDELLKTVTQAGHGTGRLDTAQLEAFALPLPPLFEQHKITQILRTWDDAMEKLSRSKGRKIALARVIRNELSSNSRWSDIVLGNVFAERAEVGGGDAVLLSVTQSSGVIRHSAAGRKDSSSADRSKYKRVVQGDIAYNTMRMWQGASGLVSEEGIVSPAYTVVVPDIARVDARYASHLFKSERMMFNFTRYSQGLTSDTWNLKYPAFSEIRVALPPLSQQRRIAGLLDAMGSEIDLLDRQLELLRMQKHGLMQKLLTGDVRVTLDDGNTND